VTEKSAVPWCARCGWNLDAYEPSRRRRETGWKRIDQATFRSAYRMSASVFAELHGIAVPRVRWSLAHLATAVIGLINLAVMLAIIGYGLLIMVRLPIPVGVPLGAIVIAMALAVRPRLGKLDKLDDPITAEAAPTLHRLIGAAAAQVGSPLPHRVLASSSWNAQSATLGLRRRRVLTIGLPLWVSLDPQERVALLARQLGPYARPGVHSGVMTRMAFGTFATLRDATRPHPDSWQRGGTIVKPIIALFHLVFTFAQLGVDRVTYRAVQLDVYGWDDVGTRVAGSAATAGLLDTLMVAEVVMPAVTRAAYAGTDPAAWHAAAMSSRASTTDRRPRLRQLSTRDGARMSAPFPATGLRAQLVASRPPVDPGLVLSAVDSDRIDAELARSYRSTRSDLIN
jgi:hypothetical protein